MLSPIAISSSPSSSVYGSSDRFDPRTNSASSVASEPIGTMSSMPASRIDRTSATGSLRASHSVSERADLQGSRHQACERQHSIVGIQDLRRGARRKRCHGDGSGGPRRRARATRRTSRAAPVRPATRWPAPRARDSRRAARRRRSGGATAARCSAPGKIVDRGRRASPAAACGRQRPARRRRDTPSRGCAGRRRPVQRRVPARRRRARRAGPGRAPAARGAPARTATPAGSGRGCRRDDAAGWRTRTTAARPGTETCRESPGARRGTTRRRRSSRRASTETTTGIPAALPTSIPSINTRTRRRSLTSISLP